MIQTGGTSAGFSILMNVLLPKAKFLEYRSGEANNLDEAINRIYNRNTKINCVYFNFLSV